MTASGLRIRNVVADTAWGRLMGMHLASTPWYVENETNFTHAAPVYALPAYGTDAQVRIHDDSARPTARSTSSRAVSAKKKKDRRRKARRRATRR